MQLCKQKQQNYNPDPSFLEPPLFSTTTSTQIISWKKNLVNQANLSQWAAYIYMDRRPAGCNTFYGLSPPRGCWNFSYSFGGSVVSFRAFTVMVFIWNMNVHSLEWQSYFDWYYSFKSACQRIDQCAEFCTKENCIKDIILCLLSNTEK